MSTSESRLIGLLRERVLNDGELSREFRDDCAWLSPPSFADERTIVTTDALIEDVHFRREAIRPRDLGWKTLAVNLSDLASKGARPTGFFLNWCLPQGISEEWAREFADGLNEAAMFGACPLLGGDTTASPGPISLSVTAVGVVRGTPPWRTGGRAGDVLVVTGGLGLSALGLAVQEGEWEGTSLSDQARHHALRRHHRPVPRLAEGRFLARSARAMMDLSDGIARDVPRLARASGLAFEARIADLPAAADLMDLRARGVLSAEEERAFAFFGGEDYELLAALPASEAPAIVQEFVDTFGTPLTAVGQLREIESLSRTSKSWTDFANPADLLKASTRFRTLGFAHFGEAPEVE